MVDEKMYILSISATIIRKNLDNPNAKELIAHMPQTLDGILHDEQLKLNFQKAIDHVCDCAPTEEKTKAEIVRKGLALETAAGTRVDIAIEANGNIVKLNDLIKEYFEPDKVEVAPGKEIDVQRIYLRINKTYTMGGSGNYT